MKFINVIVEILKVLFSGFASNFLKFNKHSRNKIEISQNKKTVISNNESKHVNLTIKKNDNTEVKGNRWK